MGIFTFRIFIVNVGMVKLNILLVLSVISLLIHFSLFTSPRSLALYWPSVLSITGGGGLRDIPLLSLMKKKKRESYQDGGEALPVRWITIETETEGTQFIPF